MTKLGKLTTFPGKIIMWLKSFSQFLGNMGVKLFSLISCSVYDRVCGIFSHYSFFTHKYLAETPCEI